MSTCFVQSGKSSISEVQAVLRAVIGLRKSPAFWGTAWLSVRINLAAKRFMGARRVFYVFFTSVEKATSRMTPPQPAGGKEGGGGEKNMHFTGSFS